MVHSLRSPPQVNSSPLPVSAQPLRLFEKGLAHKNYNKICGLKVKGLVALSRQF